MGTNFYWRLDTGESLLEPRSQDVHIGKRSAAGPYCWDCDVTLIEGGNEAIHMSGSTSYDRCPRCGALPQQQFLDHSSAGVELGFAMPRTERPVGVCSTSSFSWAEDPEHVGALCEKYANEPVVEDEYGELYTGRAFLDMLRCNCAVQFTEFIGVEFS